MVPEVFTPLRMGEVIAAIRDLLSPSRCEALVSDLGRYFQRPCFLFSSGTAALTCVLQAARNVHGRDTVIVPGYTCRKVLDAVELAGCKPLLCDVERNSFAFDRECLRRSLDGASVLAVVPSHLFGIFHPLGPVQGACQDKALLVQDCAQTFPTKEQEMRTLQDGDASIISLGRGKVLSTLGGGILVMNNAELVPAVEQVAQALPKSPILRSVKLALQFCCYKYALSPYVWRFLHFLAKRDAEEAKFYRLAPIQASLGRRLLRRVNEIKSERTRTAQEILAILSPGGRFSLPEGYQEQSTSFLRLPLLSGSAAIRDDAYRELRAEGIGVSKMYDGEQGVLSATEELLPNARQLAERLLAIPLGRHMTPERVSRCIGVLQRGHSKV